MRRFMMLIGLIALLTFLVACGNQSRTAARTTVEEPRDTAVDTATDNEEEGAVAGKPKFVEFYADW